MTLREPQGSLAATDVGSGPVIVLLHAFPVNRHLWDEVADRLAAAGHRVLAPDLPGFGDSPLPPGEPELAAMADQVFTLLGNLGIRDYTLGGLSMGGYVTMQMLRQAQTDDTLPPPKALMLMDTKMAADLEPARENRLAIADRAEAERSVEFLIEAMIPGLLGEQTVAGNPDVVARVSGWIRDTPPESVAWAQRAMARRPDSRALLSGFEGPALVLAGSDDTISPPAEQQQLASVLRNGRLVLVPSVGHLSAVEDPVTVAAAVIAFSSG